MLNAAPRHAVIRLLLVDDHPVTRAGLEEVLRDAPGFTVCGQAGTVDEALSVAASASPDVAIVDLTLGRDSGLDLVSPLARRDPPVRVLVLSAHDEQLYAERSLKAGALGYIMKSCSLADLVAAVRRVAAGKPAVSASVADRILSTLGSGRRGLQDERSPLERLSGREHEVLRLIGQGLATREIAAQLQLSPKTVESHVAHLKEKLGARSGRDLARLAVSWTDMLAPRQAGEP